MNAANALRCALVIIIALAASSMGAWAQNSESRPGQAASSDRWESVKVKTNLLTREEIERARQSRTWPETGADASQILGRARNWMEYTPKELRELVPGPEIPRAFDVHFKQSPTHPEEIKAYGSYPWIIDPKRPYKLISPVDGSAFPTNDFDPSRPGGPGDVSEEPYVDTGWGWKDPNDDQKYWFVAYWAHWFWYEHLVPAAEALGQAYILTGDQRYARQAAALLDRIAEVYPEMDYVNQSRYGTEIQKGTYHGRIVNAIWETGVVKSLARAYDFAFEGIADDPELEALTGKSVAEIRANIEQNLLEEAARSIYTMDGRIRGNFGMHHSALATLAIVLDNEITAKYLDWVLHATGNGPWSFEGIVSGLTNFIYRDGAANESSPGYNSLWTGHFQIVSELMLRRGIDMYSEYPKLRRLYDVPFRLSLPGGFTPNIGDTGSVKSSGLIGWNNRLYATAHKRYGEPSYLTGKSPYQTSDNMSAYGLGLLRRGDERNGMGLSLYYGQSGGHGHYDRLNLELFALGQRLMPDLGYPEYMTGFHKKLYGWTGHTLSHNTVLVNEQRQGSKAGGRLQAFAASPKVQYLDVRAEEAYPGVVDRYQRAVAMIDVSPDDAYVVDVFRVSGGTRHDYSLHGPDGEVVLENVTLSPVQTVGTLAGEEVPFGYLYDAPRLEEAGYSGSYGGYTGSGFSYLRNVQRARPQGVWRAEWTVRDDRRAHLRTTFLPQDGVEVVVADGEPPQNKAGNPKSLKYILARHRSEGTEPLESAFVTLLEPHRGEPVIADVTRLSEEPADAQALVALAVERGEGIDYIFQSPEPNEAYTLDDAQFQGRLGVVSRDGNGGVRFAYLLGGARLTQGDLQIESAGSYLGEILGVGPESRVATVRFVSGAFDYVQEALVGQRVVISNEHHATEYVVERVESTDKAGIYHLTLGETELLTGMGELSAADVQTISGGSGSVLRSKTPLVLGPYYKGQWLIDAATGVGGRILDIQGHGSEIRLDRALPNLQAGDTFHILDVGVGDRIEISSTVYIEARGGGEYAIESNLPVSVRLSDGKVRRVGPGAHLVQVEVPTLQWLSSFGDKSGRVRGELPLSFTLNAPTGMGVNDVLVQLSGETLYRGVEAPASDAIVIDTLTLPDGEYTIQVSFTDTLGRRFTESVTFDVDNRWQEVDDLKPPIDSGWFSFDFNKTLERSNGWAYRTDQFQAFYEDRDRLVLEAETKGGYLVWEAPLLDAFEVTLYAREARVDVTLAVSSDGATWRTLVPTITQEGPNDAGWYRLVYCGDVTSRGNLFRLTLPQSASPEELQIGKVALRGLNAD